MKKHVIGLLIVFVVCLGIRTITNTATTQDMATPEMLPQRLESDLSAFKNGLVGTYPASLYLTTGKSGAADTAIAYFKTGDQYLRFKGSQVAPAYKNTLVSIDSFFTKLKNNNNYSNKIALIREEYIHQKVPAQSLAKETEIYNYLNAMIPGESTRIPADHKYEKNMIAWYNNPPFEFAEESATKMPGRMSGQMRKVQVFYFPND